MNGEGLMECPFCGSKKIVVIDRIDCSDGQHNFYHVKCKECKALTDEYGSQYEAIVAWNRRV